MRKIVSLLFVLILILGITACGKKTVSNIKIKPNTILSELSYYVPTDFVYYPEIRGLAYTEDDRKIYVKGDYQDRSRAIIIDGIKQEISEDFDKYVEKLNKNIASDSSKYELLSKKPNIYVREKYQGKSGDTTIYNYTYLIGHNNYVYSITISGSSTEEEKLNELKTNVLKSIKLS